MSTNRHTPALFNKKEIYFLEGCIVHCMREKLSDHFLFETFILQLVIFQFKIILLCFTPHEREPPYTAINLLVKVYDTYLASWSIRDIFVFQEV